MATITTRSGKGSPLTNNEVDSNFTNLNTDKVEKSGDSITGNLSFADNAKAVFGAGSDLQIYHNGNHSFIEDSGTGNLYIRGTNFEIQSTAQEKYLAANANGGVKLYYDNAEKLATTSTGIDVTGEVSADLLKINSGTSNEVARFTSTDASASIQLIDSGGNGYLQLTNGLLYFKSNDNGSGTSGHRFYNGGSEVARIDSSGRLGLGTSSPAALLHLSGGDPEIRFSDTTNSNYSSIVNIDGNMYYKADAGNQFGNSRHRFEIDGSEKMRLDSGNLLVGKTSASANTAGIELNIAGFLRATRGGAEPLHVNRTANNGTLISLRKDNTTVGVLGNNSGGMYVGSGDTGVTFEASLNSIIPTNTSSGSYTNGQVDIGYSTTKFKDLHLSGTANAGGLDVDGTIKLDGNYPTGSNNVALGNNAFNSVTTGSNSVLIGNNAGTAITTGSYNTAVGSLAFDSSQTGSYNVALGASALRASTTGDYSVAVGTFALQSNTTGSRNVALGVNALKLNTTGQYNTALGYNALNENTTANDNVAIGNETLADNTTGGQNVAIGGYALFDSTTSAYNIAIGYSAAYSQTTGSQNVAIGKDASRLNLTGSQNTAVGYQALEANTVSGNTAVGNNALTANTTGAYNTAVGYAALDSNQTGTRNDAFGVEALYSNTGSYNSAFGSKALYSNTTGSENVAIGYQTLYNNTTGEDNTGLGQATLYANTTGNYNTAAGRLALMSNTTGSSSTAIGYNSLSSNTTGIHNVAIGASALDANTTASNNIAVGNSSLGAATTGSENLAIGKSAASTMTTASGNVALGFSALQYSTSSNNVAIGKQAMQNSTSGTQNVAIGAFALDAVNTGSYHTAVGYGTLGANTSGASNTALGYFALNANTTASNNTAVGYYALKDTTTGQRSVAVGSQALAALEDGNENVAVGQQAMKFETSGQRSVAVGFYALATQNNTGAGTNAYNTAIGALAGQSVTTGLYNTFIGGLAGDAVTTAANNTAVGYQAGAKLTTGHSNTILGAGALDEITTQTKNTVLGYQACSNKTAGDRGIYVGVQAGRTDNGDDNISIGEETMRSNSSGADRNIAMGHDALYNLNTTGSTYNIGIGYHAGRSITTGGTNTLIGGSAGDSITTGGNNIALGYNTGSALTTADNTTLLGQGAGAQITTGYGNTIIGRFDGNQGGLDIRTSNNHIVLSDGAGQPRVVVNDSGRVGIGVVSPNRVLHVEGTPQTFGSSQSVLQLSDDSAMAAGVGGGLTFCGKATTGQTDANTAFAAIHGEKENGTSANTNGVMIFSTRTSGSNPAERIRIDSSGRLLVGKTAAGGNTAGFEVRSDGDTLIARDSNRALFLNRKTTDGNILDFAKDGTTVGKIGTVSGYLYVGGTAGDDAFLSLGDNGVRPSTSAGAARDAAIDLGGSTNRFKNLHLSGGTYITGSVPRLQFNDSDGTNTQGEIRQLSDAIIIKSRNGTSNGVIRFSGDNGTTESEYARFDASGNLLVGTTTADAEGITLRGDSHYLKVVRSGGVAAYFDRRTSDGTIVAFRRQGIEKGSVYVSSTATTYNTSSDQRLKENIIDAPFASDDIDAIQVRSFDWKADGSHQKYGMVAQELQTVAPEAVTEGETEDDMMGVDYSKLVPMLVKEIQSLRARVAQLEGED